MALPQVKGLLSSEHFSVDGTLIEAWASMKSFVPKDGSGEPPGPGRNGERNFHKEKRSNETHASTTDPDARLFRKGDGQESRLCFMGSTLMENRNGLIVGADVMHATGTAEREAALILIDRREASSHGASHLGPTSSTMPRLHHSLAGPQGDTACRRQWRGLEDWARCASTLGRWPHDPASGLCHQPAHPQTHRGRLRLGQDHRWLAERSSSEACRRCAASSPSPWPPTTSSASRNCWHPRHEHDKTRTSAGPQNQSAKINGTAIETMHSKIKSRQRERNLWVFQQPAR